MPRKFSKIIPSASNASAPDPQYYYAQPQDIPVSPVSSRFPVFPVAPSLPVSPVAPGFSVSPFAPGFSVSPVAPGFSVSPVAPGFSVSPVAPGFPMSPVAPPVSPVAVGFPRSPVAPGFPVSPGLAGFQIPPGFPPGSQLVYGHPLVLPVAPGGEPLSLDTSLGNQSTNTLKYSLNGDPKKFLNNVSKAYLSRPATNPPIQGLAITLRPQSNPQMFYPWTIYPEPRTGLPYITIRDLLNAIYFDTRMLVPDGEWLRNIRSEAQQKVVMVAYRARVAREPKEGQCARRVDLLGNSTYWSGLVIRNGGMIVRGKREGVCMDLYLEPPPV